MKLKKDSLVIVKWGNSQGLRLPKDLMQAAGFQAGDHLEVSVEVDERGRKRIVLEEKISETEWMEVAESLIGSLADVDDIDFRKERAAKRERLMDKYDLSD